MTTPTLRALARELNERANEVARQIDKVIPFKCEHIGPIVGIIESALEAAQALQREADAQIVERAAIPGHAVAGPARHKAIADEIRQATSARPRTGQADVSSSVHAETYQALAIAHADLIEAHASLVQEMETYLHHRDDCKFWANNPAKNCTCGLAALLRRSAHAERLCVATTPVDGVTVICGLVEGHTGSHVSPNSRVRWRDYRTTGMETP